MPEFPLALSTNFYYASETCFRQHFEHQDPVELTEEQFDKAIQECKSQQINYSIIYEHQLLKKLDQWHADPEAASMDELDFWYAMRVIDQLTYLTLKSNLIP